ncbi:MAG TPA: DNA topoisomerase IV subunit A [Magnetospirillaceae bacterium]
MKKPTNVVLAEIHDTPLANALGERYLAYALSTIVSRSLPDVRDGLKPVHRRLLFAMRELKLDPAGGFKKCARVVGDVIGKYHPHGDVAVYDTMVRLAQDFAVRYPLVEGQGNFGNIDGDNAAAMRYTEAKLTTVAAALMEGLDENAVDFRPTYDGSEHEPVVMPAAFPNLLANGAAGIAVGMATNIPPHNVGEICDALLHLIKNPKCEVKELIDLMPGPDFPTGGLLTESKSTIVEAYSTGRGTLRLRSKWKQEKQTHGNWQIVVTEIPYQVQKSRLIEKIAELMDLRKLPLLADIRDESTDEVRIVLEPKSRAVEPAVLMEQLFRQTDFEARISLNMNVLDANSVPRVMNLKEVLRAFLDHRHEVLVRRSNNRLEKIEKRLEILEGYLKAYVDIDKVIRIIRKEDEPKPELIKAFKLTENQAEAILNLRLRSLRRLEEMEIRGEHKTLSTEQQEIKDLLGDDKKRWRSIGKEVAEIQKAFGKDTVLGKRRTQLGSAPKEIEVPIEAIIEREDITVVLSDKGWIRAMKGHTVEDFSFKEGDSLKFAIKSSTTDKFLLFATNGRFYTLSGDKLPRGRGHGEPVRLMIDLPNDADIVQVMIFKPEQKLLVVSAEGKGIVVKSDEVIAQTRAGKVVLNLDDNEEAALCVPADGDSVAIIGQNRKLLIFPLSEVPEQARGKGVILQKYKDSKVSDVQVFNKADGLSWMQAERLRTEKNIKEWIGQRAQAGHQPPQGFPRSNKFR